MFVNSERREGRKDKVIFEIGRGLLIGGLAATVFRHDIHPAFPLSAIVVGVLTLIYYVRKEARP